MDVMNTISDLHKHLILSGFTKLSGISPPHGNKKPLEQLSPGDLKLYFDGATAEEEAAARDFLSTIDFTKPLPGIPRLEEFTNAVQSHQESIGYILAMSTALDLLSKYIDTKPQLLKPYWEQLKVKENISPTYIKAVEDAARMYYIPIVELD